MKKLERSDTNKMIAGVCSGIAAYFNLDPTLVRAIFAILTFFTGIIPGIIAYVVLIFIIPPKGGKSIIEAEIVDDKKI